MFVLTPLHDCRVVDLTASLAGPFATQLLGTLGADVIKIEAPRGDDARFWKPPAAGEDAAAFVAVNGGKRSIALDLRRSSEVIKRLVETADVFVQSLRPGQAEELGLSSDDLTAANPRLVYCSIGAYGRKGPKASLPGYDPLMQAAGGIMSVTGEPGGPPLRAGVSIIDYTTGLWAGLSVVSALLQREETGRGAVVDVALYDTALNFMAHHLIGYLASGHLAQAAGTSFGGIAPYQVFHASDGAMMLAAANNRLFRSLADALDLGELGDDPRFIDNPARVTHRDELASIIGGRLAQEPRATWLARLGEAGVPCAAVQDVAEVAHDDQTIASEMIQRDFGIPLVAPAFRGDGARPTFSRRPPRTGEHTREILREAGFEDAEVDCLLQLGVATDESGRRPVPE